MITAKQALAISGLNENDLLAMLDEMVYDQKDKEASNINNENMQAQLDYLVSAIGENDLLQILGEECHS